ncbi:MAG: 50S ribosomal protein L10 [Gammaproteobacteria bacterium]|jgi:large subunit ribosomal protein L10|nr:50S ribosomal protein L10 [Gammaproteobacteria bacterium]MBT4450050.1 50S ribosomal protein L10 [Gammaproteobacteria bacterium]MBT4861912.1 50S ribosomal protein L10 [Gammaproteobacteria bacterium]MBT6456662.1 50S ribosomal protein L10 [Gammaproteobacteria bacterium]MBT6552452.1 50S ribosomal protein L10 [Gammaproteobacteria bacterium]
MPLNLQQKQAVVTEVAEVASTAHSVIAAEYQGLTVADMTELRASARESNVFLKVVKNTLAKRAFDGTDYDCMGDSLSGQLVFAFSLEEPGSAARVIKDFAGKNDKLVVRLVAFNGELLDPSEIKRLASLPTRDQAISLLMAVMKAPVEKLTRTINEVPGKLVRTVAAIRDSKQA